MIDTMDLMVQGPSRSSEITLMILGVCQMSLTRVDLAELGWNRAASHSGHLFVGPLLVSGE